jgi:two-component system sensor histidine kinase NreB
VRVVCSRTDAGALAVEVRDDGPGFDLSTAPDPGRLGLAGMRERAELLGGSFEVRAAPGSGAVVRVVLPLHESEGDEA